LTRTKIRASIRNRKDEKKYQIEGEESISIILPRFLHMFFLRAASLHEAEEHGGYRDLLVGFGQRKKCIYHLHLHLIHVCKELTSSISYAVTTDVTFRLRGKKEIAFLNQ
jgi:ascorbate-specific PTS system EIIC-type component UlaA